MLWISINFFLGASYWATTRIFNEIKRDRNNSICIKRKTSLYITKYIFPKEPIRTFSLWYFHRLIQLESLYFIPSQKKLFFPFIYSIFFGVPSVAKKWFIFIPANSLDEPSADEFSNKLMWWFACNISKHSSFFPIHLIQIERSFSLVYVLYILLFFFVSFVVLLFLSNNFLRFLFRLY